MSLVVLLPVVVPLLAGAAGVVAWRSRRAQRWLGLAGSTVHLGAAVALMVSVERTGIQVVHVGNWPAPFGIVLVADLLAAIMVLVAALIGLGVTVYSLASMDREREAYGYYPLLQILLMGVSGAFVTGDIFNLFVWFEVMLIASFVLLALGGERPQMEGSIKYVTLNLISSFFFLIAVGLLYGQTGSLNLAELALTVQATHHDGPGLLTTVAVLFLVGFGIKAAVFPLFFWLPASYHTPPVAVSAILAGLLTKVGVYALIRVFTLVFVQDVGYTHELILGIAALTMVTGVLGAAAQDDFRRILSFHIVSQIGYMVMGLGLFSRRALAGSIFYVVHHIIVKTNLFLVSGLTHRLEGSYALKDLGGLYRDRPLVAVLFLVPAMSLAGLPPLSGFFAKLILVQAGLEQQRYLVVAVALAVGLLTLFSMTKIWAEVFWKPRPGGAAGPRPRLAGMLGPVMVFATITLALSVLVGPAFDLADRAAGQLLEPGDYIRAVLGSRR